VRPFPHRFALAPAFLLALAGFVCPAQAQWVDVTTVKFSNLRTPQGSAGNWYEVDIALNAKPAPGSPGQMVPRVRVAVLLGFELAGPPGGERRLEYYRAEAECVALEPGRADVRFYLPAEIVKRDQLHGDPKYWTVELSVEGKPVTVGRAAYSGSLASPDLRKNFQKRAGVAAAANEGILHPQYLSPFVNENPRATPSFVRRDAR
jgi:hypothetical protein